jgi:hypothetical protein
MIFDAARLISAYIELSGLDLVLVRRLTNVKVTLIDVVLSSEVYEVRNITSKVYILTYPGRAYILVKFVKSQSDDFAGDRISCAP